MRYSLSKSSWLFKEDFFCPPSQEQASASHSAHTSPFLDSSQEAQSRIHQQETSQIKEIENCVFNPEREEQIIAELSDAAPNYISFSCNNSGQHEEVITSGWTIWIPKTLLREATTPFTEGQRINIKTLTTSSTTDSEISLFSDKYTTRFESKSFSIDSITGKWGNSIIGEDYRNVDSFIYAVTITNPQLENTVIYLRLK